MIIVRKSFQDQSPEPKTVRSVFGSAKGNALKKVRKHSILKRGQLVRTRVIVRGIWFRSAKKALKPLDSLIIILIRKPNPQPCQHRIGMQAEMVMVYQVLDGPQILLLVQLVTEKLLFMILDYLLPAISRAQGQTMRGRVCAVETTKLPDFKRTQP